MVAATSVNFGNSIFTERAAGPSPMMRIQLVILHRRIEDLLHRRIEAVDLVDEQDVALFEVGELRGEIPGLGDHRAGGRAEVHPQFAGDDLGERGLAEAGRADEQDVVEGLAGLLRRVDEHLEIGARRLLAGEVGEAERPDRGVGVVLAALGGEEGFAGLAQRGT